MKSCHLLRFLGLFLFLGIETLCCSTQVHAGTSAEIESRTRDSRGLLPLSESTMGLPSILSGSINLEYANSHVTFRGLNLQDKGLVTQQKLSLDWRLYGQREEAADLNEFSLMTGVWNDVDSVPGGAVKGNWDEIDPSIGLRWRFFRDWVFESPFTCFISETGSYPDCWNWDPKLIYHDHLFKSFSINPYVGFFDEISNKSTVVFTPSSSTSGYYGTLGMDPTYPFTIIPLKLELPCYLTLPSDNFYQRRSGTDGGTGLGLASTMLKASVPLEFIPDAYGSWAVYAGIQYDYLDNEGLLDGNQYAGAALSRQRNLVIYHAGVTVKF